MGVRWFSVEGCSSAFVNSFHFPFSRIGRHSKSLNTQRFVCALCKGQLVLCQPTRKDGTPATAHLAPFAKYVKENYGSTKQSQQGLSHGAIMKKLSTDFAAQTSLLSPWIPSAVSRCEAAPIPRSQASSQEGKTLGMVWKQEGVWEYPSTWPCPCCVLFLIFVSVNLFAPWAQKLF